MAATHQYMPDDAKTKLRQQFLNRPAEQHTKGWDELWQQDVTPWDRNGPSLALRDAVVGKSDILGPPLKDSGSKNRKRALVPGCGRGYDVLLLSSLGYDAYGVDASQTAINAAERLKSQSATSETYAAFDPDVGNGDVKFLLNDFFKDDFLAETNGQDFDLIFDYTFLCALPPELRAPWAKRMSQLLSPDGHLICLEWPLGKDPKEGGPPHGLSSELYVQLLSRPGEEVQYKESGLVAENESPEKGNSAALVRVAHYMPDKTHEAGKGKDFVSIWKHQGA